jgi:hypothetical protein
MGLAIMAEARLRVYVRTFISFVVALVCPSCARGPHGVYCEAGGFSERLILATLSATTSSTQGGSGSLRCSWAPSWQLNPQPRSGPFKPRGPSLAAPSDLGRRAHFLGTLVC